MSALLCVIIAFVLGWVCCGIINNISKRDGFLFVEANGDTPEMYMELNIDISELRNLDTVELEVKKLIPKNSR